MKKLAKDRIEKFIASKSGLSRKEAKEAVKEGRVKINGTIADKHIQYIDPDNDNIELDETFLGNEKFVYIMMNKPKGVLSASKDTRQKTIIDLLPDSFNKPSLFPVGRLDKNTTGLIIITNDGEFAHKVISPKSGIPKVYKVTLDDDIPASAVRKFADGITLADGTKCLPAELKIGENRNECLVTIYEGKYHQIKRMFGTVGLGVNELHRKSVGNLKLDSSLKEGEFRLISELEVKMPNLNPQH